MNNAANPHNECLLYLLATKGFENNLFRADAGCNLHSIFTIFYSIKIITEMSKTRDFYSGERLTDIFVDLDKMSNNRAISLTVPDIRMDL